MAALFRSECEKYVILVDCANAILNYKGSGSEAGHPDQIEACYSRLTGWWHTRRSSLNPEKVPSKENILCAYVNRTPRHIFADYLV
jgi:hypothetical protein